MTPKLLPSFFAAMFLAATGTASATVTGLYQGSYITTWDSFTSVSASGQTASSPGSYVSAALSTAMAGGNVTGLGDRIYAGSFGPGSFAFDISLDGTATIDLSEISLVLKFTPPSVGTAINFFTVSFNGSAGSTPELVTTSLEDTNNFQIYKWTWSNADLQAGDAINFQIDSYADHVSLDAVQIVPETSTAMLGAAACGLFLIRRRA